MEGQCGYVDVSCSPTADCCADVPQWSLFSYSNGGLDPWSAGGVTQNITDSLVAVVIPDGAHHLDLRSHNPLDPKSVQQARALEICYMKQWIEEAMHKHWSGTVITVAIIPPLALLGVGPGLIMWSFGHFTPASSPVLPHSANSAFAHKSSRLQMDGEHSQIINLSRRVRWAACSGLVSTSALLKCCASW